MGWGTTAAARSDGFGSFVTGALAALVATPCTAPFMGTAVGFALTQPWTSAVTVMLALGFGLALPYLLLTWLPGLARWLPHPGPWMERLKQFLAFPLFASVAWLIWVLAVQVGPSGVLAALMALVAAALAIWVGQLAGERPGVRATAAALAIAALALAAAPEALPPANGPVAAAVSAAEIGVREEPFSQQRLDRLREAGTPVFVNMTAAWCITCKLNEQVALASERVARAFAEGGFVYLKGDWTNRNPEITRFLQDFGRSGVPLYVVYPGDGRPPAVLPQLLTEAIVLEAVGGPDKLTATPSTTERTY
jgi:thiol:disulfide interchange protein DsbD